MLDQKTIDAFKRLLGLYEGVEVERLHADPTGSAWAVMKITEQETAGRLAQWAADAVVDFFILPEGDGRTFSERIRYQLRAAPSSNESEPELRVVTFCVCLAQDLANRGLLERDEVAELRHGWGY